MSVYDAFHANHEIIPSPGTEDKEWAEIEKKIEMVKPFAKTIHIDVIDGKFAANTTFLDPKPFQKYTKDMVFEVHLMVDNPIQYLKPFADAGFRRFIGQIEKMPDVIEFIAQGQFLGEVALGIDTETSIEKLTMNPDDLDAVLIMTVKAGLSGQKFIPEMLEKVKKLRERSATLPVEVDGGINSETILLAKNAGATRFVATSAMFSTENPQKQFTILQDLL